MNPDYCGFLLLVWVTTFLENLEMSWNLTASRKLIICRGKLFTAYLKFGTVSVFSGLFWLHIAILEGFFLS